MKVVSFMQSVPSLSKSIGTEKELILKYFAEGVRANADTGVLHYKTHLIQDADVAVIQGWVHDKWTSPHLQTRKKVIDYYLQNQKHVISADANLFLYANKTNKPHHFLRYSFDGIFPNTGIYCDTEIDTKRWQKISNQLGIKLSPQKNLGNHILLCCQRNGGWSMGNLPVINWIEHTVLQLRRFTDRPIILRAHPGDKKSSEYLDPTNKRIKRLVNVSISAPGKPIEKDLENAWAVVNHNSSSIVGPIIYGYHSFITDPKKSQCADVSNTDFSLIENPIVFDRQSWLERICMFHWSFDELKNGDCWRHMRKFI